MLPVGGWMVGRYDGRTTSTYPFALLKQCYRRDLVVEYLVPNGPGRGLVRVKHLLVYVDKVEPF